MERGFVLTNFTKNCSTDYVYGGLVVEHLLSIHGALLDLQHFGNGIRWCTITVSGFRKAVTEAGRSGIQGHLPLHSDLEASLSYMRPCLQKA